MILKSAPELKKITLDTLHTVVLVLSALLIAYISYDTFKSIYFLHDDRYMAFQLFVCIIFILDFFIELIMSPDKWYYLRHRWIFLVLSIPYLNIIRHYNLSMSADAIYFIRFIPLARGALALSIVIGYISNNRITSILASYVSIMVLITYFSGLIFFEQEHPVNPLVHSYWDAFWWGCMEVTSIGCDIYPVTLSGKILCVVLSLMGMIMFPLFTVYLTNLIISRHKGTKSTDYSA